MVSAANHSKLYVTNYGDNSVSVIKLSPGFSEDKSTRGVTDSGGLEILVKFKPDIEESRVRALELEVGLQHVKTITALNLKVYKVTSNKSLEEVIAACEKASFVEYAEPNQKVSAQK